MMGVKNCTDDNQNLEKKTTGFMSSGVPTVSVAGLFWAGDFYYILPMTILFVVLLPYFRFTTKDFY